MNQEISNMFHIVSTLSDRVQTFLCKYANMAKKWQQCRFNGSSCKKVPSALIYCPLLISLSSFWTKMQKKLINPHIVLFFPLYCLFEQRWNFPIFKGHLNLFAQKVNFSFFSNLNLRSCSNVQKKNLRSCEKSKVAFLMSVVLPEYLMRLTPEKTW